MEWNWKNFKKPKFGTNQIQTLIKPNLVEIFDYFATF